MSSSNGGRGDQQQHFDKHKLVAYWQHHYFGCASPAATQPSVTFYSPPNHPGLLDHLLNAESFLIVIFSDESLCGRLIQQQIILALFVEMGMCSIQQKGCPVLLSFRKSGTIMLYCHIL